MIRATTIGVLKGYRTNLMQSFITQSTAMKNVLKPRNFHSYADDTASASRAYQIRRALQRTGAQLTSSQSVTYKFESAWSSLDHVVSDINNGKEQSEWDKVIRALNDPTGDGRTALGKAMISLGDDIIQAMNSKYGDNFIFAGADELNVPFEIRSDGHVYYRGVNVDTEVPLRVGESKVGVGTPITVTQDANGNYKLDPTSQTYLYSRGVTPMSVTAYTNATKLVEDPANPGSPLLVDATGAPSATGTYRILASATGSVSKDAYDAAAPGTYTVLKDATGAPVADANGNYTVLNGALMTEEEYKDSVPNVLMEADGTTPAEVDENGVPTAGGGFYLVTDNAKTITEDEYKQAQIDLAKLEYMSQETNYVDIGRGLQEDLDGNLIESSAFNQALQGINFLGYGVDEDGDPKNLVSLARRMGEICNQFHDGEWDKNNPGWQELNRLANKFEKMADELHTMHVDMDSDAKALKNNNELLTANADTMKEQIHDIEDMDEAEAISSFIWAQYCYNAALRVGNSVLSESLMDYMS